MDTTATFTQLIKRPVKTFVETQFKLLMENQINLLRRDNRKLERKNMQEYWNRVLNALIHDTMPADYNVETLSIEKDYPHILSPGDHFEIEENIKSRVEKRVFYQDGRIEYILQSRRELLFVNEFYEEFTQLLEEFCE